MKTIERRLRRLEERLGTAAENEEARSTGAHSIMNIQFIAPGGAVASSLSLTLSAPRANYRRSGWRTRTSRKSW